MDELQIEMPTNEPVIAFRRRVAAHPDLVFRLFTEAQHLRRWWGPRRLGLVECEIDLYIGGGYRLVQQAPDGQRFSFHGTYLAIVRPHRLVQTFVYEGRPNNEVVETFSFAPIDGGTLVQCRSVHTSVEDRDAHAASGASAGLTESYQRQEQLVTHLQNGVLP